MDKDKNKELWYKPAIMMFANISGWIAGPIILALFLGKYLDNKYHSGQWFFIGLTVLAFFISIGGIWRILKKYIDSINAEIEEKKSQKNNQDGDNV
jgi:F0F1-type ATP synthase assembly protein I